MIFIIDILSLLTEFHEWIFIDGSFVLVFDCNLLSRYRYFSQHYHNNGLFKNKYVPLLSLMNRGNGNIFIHQEDLVFSFG